MVVTTIDEIELEWMELLSVRTKRCLREMGMQTVGDVRMKLEAEGEAGLLLHKGFGRRSFLELREAIKPEYLELYTKPLPPPRCFAVCYPYNWGRRWMQRVSDIGKSSDGVIRSFLKSKHGLYKLYEQNQYNQEWINEQWAIQESKGYCIKEFEMIEVRPDEQDAASASR